MKDYSGFAGVSRPRGTFVSNVFDHSGALENYKKGKSNIPCRLLAIFPEVRISLEK